MLLEFSEALRKEFQRLHSLEWQLFDALKMLEGTAQNPDLKAAFAQHRNETKVHLERLEQIGRQLDLPVIGLPNLPMKALSEELLQDLRGAEPGPITDAMLIGAAQKGEHLEMAWYGFLRSLCQRVGATEAVALLDQNLEDEKRTDKLLTEIAEKMVNDQAATQTVPETVATQHGFTA